MTRSPNAVPIEQVVNIGPALGRDLRRAGILTLAHLLRLGPAKAWRAMRKAGSKHDCVNAHLALAGAVEGVRWHDLPAAARERIAALARAEAARPVKQRMASAAAQPGRKAKK